MVGWVRGRGIYFYPHIWFINLNSQFFIKDDPSLQNPQEKIYNYIPMLVIILHNYNNTIINDS